MFRLALINYTPFSPQPGRGNGEALPPAGLSMKRFSRTFSFMAAFTILAVSSIISEFSMPLIIFPNRKALSQDSS